MIDASSLALEIYIFDICTGPRAKYGLQTYMPSSHNRQTNAGIAIYWINLDKSPDRKQEMMKQLNVLKANHKRIQAVDSSQLMNYDIAKSWKCHWTSDAEYACTLSHIKAIAQAYKDNRDTALIMEDDMKILRLPTRHLLNIAPSDWDIIQLSTTGPYTWKIYGNPKSYFVPWHHFYPNTGGYVINKRGMVNLLYALAPETLQKADLKHISFVMTKLRLLPFPATKACNADYVLYSLVKTYTCCDISMHEDRNFDSTIQTQSIVKHYQDKSARLIQSIFKERGFLLPWKPDL